MAAGAAPEDAGAVAPRVSTPAHARYLSARLVVSVIACLDPRSAARPAAPRYDFDYIARYGTRRLVARATASIPAFASTSDPPRARGLIPAPDSLTRSTLYFCSTPWHRSVCPLSAFPSLGAQVCAPRYWVSRVPTLWFSFALFLIPFCFAFSSWPVLWIYLCGASPT